MEIESSSSYLPIRGSDLRSARRVEPRRTDASDFGEAEALRTALEKTPDVRPEAVARGKELVSLSSYPPPETLDRLARLLALELSTESRMGAGAKPAS